MTDFGLGEATGWFVGMLVVLAAPLVGCQDEENFLRGSVSSRYDLTFSQTRARLYDSELSVEYVREDEQIPVRVIIDRDATSLGVRSYNLEQKGDVRGRVDAVKLPSLHSGQFQLDAFQDRDGTRIEGSFDSRLTAADSRVTLRGEFVTELEVVDEERGYEFDTGVDVGDAGDVGDAAGELGIDGEN